MSFNITYNKVFPMADLVLYRKDGNGLTELARERGSNAALIENRFTLLLHTNFVQKRYNKNTEYVFRLLKEEGDVNLPNTDLTVTNPASVPYTEQKCAAELGLPDANYLLQKNSNSEIIAVTDKLTNLMWQRCPLGLTGEKCDQGEAKETQYIEENTNIPGYKSITQLVSDFNSGSADNNLGYSDWRMPTLKELYSTFEASCMPSVNLKVFPSADLYSYWPNEQTIPDPQWSTNQQVAVTGHATTFNYVKALVTTDYRRGLHNIRLVRKAP